MTTCCMAFHLHFPFAIQNIYKFFVAKLFIPIVTMEKQTFKVLIAATGSVAAIKVPLLFDSLKELNTHNSAYCIEPQVMVTEHAKHFIEDFNKLNAHEDSTEWLAWQKRGDPVVHIELGKWADLMVIAPLDANTLAKISQGICDNLVTSTVRAWDLKKPLLFCPAMNTRMWEHPITSKQIATLKEWGYEEIPPISKTLMCGDTGIGAMQEVPIIVERIKTIADNKFHL